MRVPVARSHQAWKAQVIDVHGRVGEDHDAPPPGGGETEKALVAAGSAVVPDDAILVLLID